MSGLPAGWASAPIIDLCSLKNGRAFKPTDWVEKGVPIVRIQNLNNMNAKFNYFDGEIDERFRLRGEELLFAWSGTPGTSFGAHVWHGKDAVLNQHIFRIDFDESNIHKRFFRHAINQKLDDLIGLAHGGAGLQHVTKGKFERTEIWLPPLAEQKRIVDKLDALLARVDAARARLDRVPALLKRFRQSVLAAATSGQLAEDWCALTRHSRVGGNPASSDVSGVKALDSRLRGNDGWVNTPLKELVVEPLRNGKSVKDGDGDAVLRLTSLRRGTFDWKESKRGDWTGLDASRFFVSSGDFLVVRGNGSQDLVGRGGLVVDPPERMAFPDTLIRVRPDSRKLLPKYLVLVWDSASIRQQIERSAKTTTGLWKVAQGDLEAVVIHLPPITEQQEIVHRVEALFTLADKVQAQYAAARARIDRLTPAILAKAFRGELVPQDPDDEPAGVLLERIRARRAAAPKPVRRGRKAGGSGASARGSAP